MQVFTNDNPHEMHQRYMLGLIGLMRKADWNADLEVEMTFCLELLENLVQVPETYMYVDTDGQVGTGKVA